MYSVELWPATYWIFAWLKKRQRYFIITYYRYVSQRLHLLSLQLTFYKNIILTYNWYSHKVATLDIHPSRRTIVSMVVYYPAWMKVICCHANLLYMKVEILLHIWLFPDCGQPTNHAILLLPFSK